MSHHQKNGTVVASLPGRSQHPFSSVAMSPNRRYCVIAGKDTIQIAKVGHEGLKPFRKLQVSQVKFLHFFSVCFVIFLIDPTWWLITFSVFAFVPSFFLSSNCHCSIFKLGPVLILCHKPSGRVMAMSETRLILQPSSNHVHVREWFM